MGHEERFPPPKLSAGYGLRKETIAEVRHNGRDAPVPDLAGPSLVCTRERIRVIRLTAAPGCMMSSPDVVPREESERRLAAILIADVVGYSRLMQADEEGTLARVQDIATNIVDPRVAAHRGRIFRTMGDGLLIEFPSVVEALLCAAEIQEELRLLGDERPPEERIQLRIGITVGDVIRRGNDVFGTGVNIAARLESMAEPGSIYISGEAYDQVRDRPFAFDDLGMKAVKNIARLVRVYRVRAGEAAGPSYPAAHWRTRNWRVGAMMAGSVIGLALPTRPGPMR
jgi:adenylate cyclase